MTGRKTKYTPERTARIIEGLRAGMTRRAACGVGHISDETFALWLKKKLDFLEQVTEAENEAEARYTAIIANAAMKEKDWRAALEWLKRRRRQDWGEKLEVGGPDGGPLKVTLEWPEQRLKNAEND